MPATADIAQIIELAAVVLSMAAVLLAIKPYTANWPVAMAGTLLYGWIFFECRLYSDMVLQFIFIAMQAFGWWQWSKKQSTANIISSLTGRQWLIESVVFLTAWGVWTWLLIAFLPWLSVLLGIYIPRPAMPWLDSFTASLSVWAIILQARRKWENWILWLLADIIYIPLYVSVGIPLTALLYTVFLLLAVFGLRSWYRQRV
jgi:nicotinamide mononucleotide transporter